MGSPSAPKIWNFREFTKRFVRVLCLGSPALRAVIQDIDQAITVAGPEAIVDLLVTEGELTVGQARRLIGILQGLKGRGRGVAVEVGR